MNSRRVMFWMYVLLFGAVVLGSGTYFIQTREEFNRQRSLEQANRLRLEEMEARLARREVYLDRLQTDPQLVERVIRQRLGYIRPEEGVFRFEE